MSYTAVMAFEFADTITLRDSSIVMPLLNDLVTLFGFRIKKSNAVAEESSGSLWEALLASPEGYALIKFSNGFGVEFILTVNFSSANELLFLFGDDIIWHRNVDALSNLHLLRHIFIHGYSTLRPSYGYGLPSLNSYEPRDDDEADSIITAIYDYNFFGPKLLEQLGRDVILLVPSWKTTTLVDGGMFLEMSSNPYHPQYIKDLQPKYEQAAKLLGVDKFHQGG